LKWRLAALTHAIGFIAVVMLALVLMSGTIRSYIPVLIDRQLARVWPFTYAVVGDSLAAECPWKWAFGLSPVAVANLAVAGSDLRRTDPPPLKWSDLRYVFDIQEDCNGKEAIQA